MDKTDREILALLAANARLSIAKLAEDVGVSRATAYKRIQALTDSNAIRGYTTVLDRKALGLSVTALVMARVNQNKWREARDAVQGLPSVKYAGLVTGDHDLVMTVQATDMDSLRDVVLHEINGLPSIHMTRTMLILDEIVDRVNPTPELMGELPD